MLRNYIKVAARTLWKHKGFTAMNITGLALSMAVCLLIILFVREQSNYDRFHERADRTYRVVADAVDPDSNIVPVGATPAPLAAVHESEIAGVEETVRPAWVINRTWLHEFANRTEFGLFDLVVSVGALVALAVLTIGSQTLRAALANPVKSIGQE